MDQPLMNAKSHLLAIPPKKTIARTLFLIFLASLCPACHSSHEPTLEFTWVKVQSRQVPPARMDAAMTSDPGSGRIYMFGGRGENGCLDDLWNYTPEDGWVLISADEGPSARSGASIVIEPSQGRLLVFGGYCANVEGSLEFNKEIWFYSEKDGWSREYTKGGPRPRAWQSMTVDSQGSILVFGGVTPPPSFYRNDLWRLDLHEMKWTRAANDGGPLMAGRSALLASKQHPLVVFGRMGVRNPKDAAAFWLDKMDWERTRVESPLSPPADFQLAFVDTSDGSLLALRGPKEHSKEVSWDLWQLTRPWDDSSDWEFGRTNSGPAFVQGMMCSALQGKGSLICFGGAKESRLSDETWRLKITGRTGE